VRVFWSAPFLEGAAVGIPSIIVGSGIPLLKREKSAVGFLLRKSCIPPVQKMR
jgi:hypothetical protein